MRRVKFLEELRQMRFEESYSGYRSGRLSQEEAAKILGVCSRTFRRYMTGVTHFLIFHIQISFLNRLYNLPDLQRSTIFF